jgi:hypothetical protein
LCKVFVLWNFIKTAKESGWDCAWTITSEMLGNLHTYKKGSKGLLSGTSGFFAYCILRSSSPYGVHRVVHLRLQCSKRVG